MTSKSLRSCSSCASRTGAVLKYQGKNPEELTCQDVRTFLLAKKDEGLKAATLNLYNSAIRFFYRNVLHILWDDITVPRMILEHRLPTVLTAPEIDRLLEALGYIQRLLNRHITENTSDARSVERNIISGILSTGRLPGFCGI